MISAENLNDIIADNIIRMRQERGLSQETVAARLQTLGINYTRGRLSMIETKKRPPSAVLLVGLKLLFGCEYKDFFHEVERRLSENMPGITLK